MQRCNKESRGSGSTATRRTTTTTEPTTVIKRNKRKLWVLLDEILNFLFENDQIYQSTQCKFPIVLPPSGAAKCAFMCASMARFHGDLPTNANGDPAETLEVRRKAAEPRLRSSFRLISPVILTRKI